MTIIIFIIILLVCVLVHEWGHYIVAKKSGMLIEEFGFGIPPRIWGKKKGETLYSVNALPIGGFVKIAGENGAEEGVPIERQFESKPWYAKSAVLIAGVVMNFFLAIILFTAAYSIGLPAITPSGVPTVTTIVPSSPAAASGIKVGDMVVGVEVGGTEVALNTKDIHDAIVASNSTVSITYTHNHVSNVVEIQPVDHLIGIGVDPVGIVKEPFSRALGLAWKQSVAMIGQILHTLGALIRGVFAGGVGGLGLMGPVGLAHEVGTAATFGIVYLLAFTATISLNLAVLNIMPFPALDGGRLIVVWGEALTRKKFSKTTIGVIHTIGFILLILLMLYLTIGDVKKLL